jgi:hypothetical protein
MELDKFWTEEISRAIKALKMRRIDPTDLERWKNFHANLQTSIGSWKVLSGLLFLCRAFLTGQTAFSSLSYQAVLLDPYVAILMQARLRFCPFSLSLWHLLRLTVRRKLTSGR